MNQLRWLDHVVNSQELTEKIFEILSVAGLEVQREIVAALPEVTDDSQHAAVAVRLKQILQEQRQLATTVLDALSNLNLGADLLAEVRNSVIDTLPSADFDDLPIIVKFLLQTVSALEAAEVVAELRANLDLRSTIPPNSASTPFNKSANRSDLRGRSKDIGQSRCSEMLTIDAIHSAIRFQRSVAEAWLKTIEAVRSAADHRVIDLVVLFILHVTNYKKPVESLFRNKIRASHFTEGLLQTTFSSHTQVVHEYFPAVLSLAETLLRSPEPVISHFASAIYRHAFLTFDVYGRQEVVGNLVTHIGSGSPGEVEGSLDILARLIETDVQKMVPFAVFVKGVLDYLDQLTTAQIRKLYSMLSVLGFKNAGRDSLLQDEMHILIRKQLSNNDPKYKRMGVIGAVMVVQGLAASSGGDTSLEGSVDTIDVSSISDDIYKQVVGLLKLVNTSAARSMEASALLKDELATVIQRGCLNRQVELWICENVINDFQDDFVVDIDPVQTSIHQRKSTSHFVVDIDPVQTSTSVAGLAMSLQFGLDDENDGTIAINLLPLVASNSKSRVDIIATGERQVSPVSLAPHFRLLQMCEGRQHDGDLEEIDALLGCPLYLPCPEVADKLGCLNQGEKQILCHSLFLAVNWFREVVNAFASQTDTEMKAKVLSRLQHITQTSTLLEKCLAGRCRCRQLLLTNVLKQLL
ncbi:Fanconi anemia group D2 protein [Lamellibrachia satsuma]|nr:Fanconi anemia group D2 protein [Lamellibrachia satsuma]